MSLTSSASGGPRPCRSAETASCPRRRTAPRRCYGKARRPSGRRNRKGPLAHPRRAQVENQASEGTLPGPSAARTAPHRIPARARGLPDVFLRPPHDVQSQGVDARRQLLLRQAQRNLLPSVEVLDHDAGQNLLQGQGGRGTVKAHRSLQWGQGEGQRVSNPQEALATQFQFWRVAFGHAGFERGGSST